MPGQPLAAPSFAAAHGYRKQRSHAVGRGEGDCCVQPLRWRILVLLPVCDAAHPTTVVWSEGTEGVQGEWLTEGHQLCRVTALCPYPLYVHICCSSQWGLYPL